ncbi:hypothetical protein [Loktanella sp. M215]|uniref:hypothetical protein n=1 Tax=Loktanella sp. M215 TaxID=2675431 RepID=UPI001F177301|nr:hypothetical protein [Loktanella sp. M215]MCF7699878.1 hypothetical protein [Loktanella sp. M215]
MLGRVQFAVALVAIVAAFGAYVLSLRSDLRATDVELQASRLAVSAYAEAADVMVAQVEALRTARPASDAAYIDRLARIRAAKGVCVDEALPGALLD